jgi:N,N-dimethylformamidase
VPHGAIGALHNPDIRADMVFFECPNGGAVFSVGSIAYAASLMHNGFDNNIARITGNVLKRFLDPEPFYMPKM